MKTQQADSLGRDAALRRPRIIAPPRTAQRAVPTIWLNLVCLDAPLVALAWLWLFARTFDVPLQIGNAVALFLTAWLIYLADRFADASNLKSESPRSLRQGFCLRHREFWIATLALVAGFDAYVIWKAISGQTFVIGAIVGTAALIYLVLNHPLGLIWRSLPAKELAIGSLFAAGVMVALLPHVVVTPPLGIAAFLFAALCSLNCISVAGWERELDESQRKVSIATLHPAIMGRVGLLCVGLAAASLVLAFFFGKAAMFFACVSVSALLLACLNASCGPKEGRFTDRPRSRNRGINRRSLVGTPDQRTALADLVLLTPVIAILLAAL